MLTMIYSIYHVTFSPFLPYPIPCPVIQIAETLLILTHITLDAGMGLSSGLNSSSKSDIAESKAFRINLFPDTDGFMKGDGGGSKGSDDEGSGSSNFIMIDIDGTADSKTFERYMQDLNLEEEGGRAKQGPDEEDDLLALMDSSCK